jgi:hypothetical protein
MNTVGSLPAGATATDGVPRTTEMLRGHGVVVRFVEFYGAGLSGSGWTRTPGPWDCSAVVAAITSCTNTSNPSVMAGAGLVAKTAAERGLMARHQVKTSRAPGSTVVTDYRVDPGVLQALEELGFRVVGYRCMTSMGNSGPLPGPWRRPFGTTASWSPRSSRGIGTAKPVSSPGSERTTWPRRCSSWPTPWPDGWTPASCDEPRRRAHEARLPGLPLGAPQDRPRRDVAAVRGDTVRLPGGPP